MRNTVADCISFPPAAVLGGISTMNAIDTLPAERFPLAPSMPEVARSNTDANMDYMIGANQRAEVASVVHNAPESPEVLAKREQRMKLYGCLDY